MKKNLKLFIIGVIVVLAALVLGLIVSKQLTKPKLNSKTATQPKRENPSCKIFTLTEATKILGDGTAADPVNDNQPVDANNITSSTCSYTFSDTTVAQTASVTVRSPINESGKAIIKSQFTSNKVSASQDVSGYGDSAFWDNNFGQLNVLKNNTWYTITNGPVGPSDRKLDQTKKLADVLNPKL